MNGMNIQERLNDISSISGVSEKVVRRVLDAERQSIIKSLKRGEKATLIGRCIIKPELKDKLGIGGKVEKSIKLNAMVSNSLRVALQDCSEFEVDTDDSNEAGVLIRQIPSLE